MAFDWIISVRKPAAERLYHYNRTVRYDWLSHYLFESIGEVQDYATQWMWTYNHERPNMALGGIAPKQKLDFLQTLLLTKTKNGWITTPPFFTSKDSKVFKKQYDFFYSICIKPAKENLSGILFFGGLIAIFIGAILGDDIDKFSFIPSGTGHAILQGGSAVLGAGVFAVIMKSGQFTNLFQQHIYDVFYDPSKVKDAETLIEKWRAIANFLLKDTLPTSYTKASNAIEKQFFNSELEYHFEDYNVTHDIEIANNIATIKTTTITQIVLSPTASNPTFKYAMKLHDTGTNELNAFRLNDESFTADLYKIDTNDQNQRTIEIPLKNHVKNLNGCIKMERTTTTTQNLKNDPLIATKISRYINGATVGVKCSSGYRIHFERFGLGELPIQHYLDDDGRGYKRWTLATQNCLLLPGQGYIIIPVLVGQSLEGKIS